MLHSAMIRERMQPDKTGRLLVALDSMRSDPKGEELIFLVRAWKAAFAKAQSLGWLN